MRMRAGWNRGSRSNGTGGSNCVEVAEIFGDNTVAVRNSKAPQVAVLFTGAEWDAFVESVKLGEFDRSAE